MCGINFLSRSGKLVNSVYTILLPYTILGLFLITGNMMGVLPYVKAPASDIRIALGLAGIVMGALILLNLFNKRSKYVINFMPESNIYMLLPLVALEILAYLNRCLSLGLRILINLAAGKFMTHVILEVVGVGFFSLTGIGVFLSFEILVAYLQCYIFCYISKLK